MFNLMIMFFIIMLISILLLLINMILSYNKINDREKLTPFECGFDPLVSARLPFSMQFYMIGIIFLIFDIEIIIFLPMITSFMSNKFNNWLNTSMIFIIILLIGLYLEWNDGALMWMK